jgi:hypothetical protein
MSRRVWASVVAAGAAVALVPCTVVAEQPSSGSASTATLSLTVSPNALLAVPSSVAAPVAAQLQAALQPISVQIDGAHTAGTRSASAADLSAGHADVTPLSINLEPLSQLLTELHSALTGLYGQISIPALPSALADVAAITGNSTVMGLLPSQLAADLTALNQQLASLTTKLANLPSDLTTAVDALQSTLIQSLGQQAKLVEGLSADLDSAHPNGQNSAQSAITVPPAVQLPPTVPTLPVVAQLAPFGATAVNAAGAHLYGVSGPQASSDESTTNLAVSPSMDLTNLQNDMAALQAVLQQVSGSISAIQPQLGAVAAIIAQALPGGLDLSTLATQVTAATTPADQLAQLAQSLQLNKLLSCNPQSSGACTIAATSVTPSGAGVHAMASSKLVDLAVLPMSSTLATALSPLGAATGTPLLDVQGVQATADSFVDGDNGSQTTSSTLSHIAVAGLTVVDNGQIAKQSLSGHTCQPDVSTLPDTPPVGEPMTLCLATPGGDLTLVITVGTPQYTYTGATHRSASLSKLELRILNGAPDRSNPVTALGATAAGPIATADMGGVTSEVLGTSATLVPTSQQGSNVVMEQTGMFGAGSLVVGFGLLGLGFGLRRASRRPTRRRGGVA